MQGNALMLPHPTSTWYLTLVANLALCLTVASISRADTMISEDFAGGLDVVLFHTTASPGVTLEAVSEQLHVIGTEGTGEPPHYSGGYLFANFILIGDFDVSVYYENFSAPYPGPGKSTWCGLIFYEATGTYVCSIGRERGLAAGLDRYIAYPQPWGEVATSETSGHVRMVRNGSTFQAYSGTTLLGTKTLTIAPILLGVGSQRLEHLQSFSVRYDDLEIVADYAELYIRRPWTVLSGYIDVWHAVHVVDGGSIVVPPATWNGETQEWEGGYLMLEADTIYVDSTSAIYADGVGFSSNPNSPDGHSGGGPGHGHEGGGVTGAYSGGGGGFGGMGGHCPTTAQPGTPYGPADQDDTFVDTIFGSAGGTYLFETGDPPTILASAYGGRGGGYIRLRGSTITIEGEVTANGDDGAVCSPPWSGDWAGIGSGGGSGGQLVIDGGTVSISGLVEARGGTGSDPSYWASGGGGSGGRIKVFATTDFSCGGIIHAPGGAGACGGQGAGDVGTVHLPAIPSEPPSALDLLAADDTGRNSGDHLTKVNRPRITGSAPPNAAIRLYEGTVQIGSGESASDGQFTAMVNTALPDGPHTITATAQENCHSPSSLSTSTVQVAVDTQPPAVPSIPDLTPGSDTGIYDDDNVTRDWGPLMQGTSEADTDVTLYEGATSLGTVYTADGNWQVLSDPLDEGLRQLAASATDAAGNESAHSSALSILVDVTDPVVSNPSVVPTGCHPIGQVFDLEVTATDALSGIPSSDVPEATIRENTHTIAHLNLPLIGGGRYGTTWDSTGTLAGMYSVDFEARDVAGNLVTLEDAATICLEFAAGDINEDGYVDMGDLSLFVAVLIGEDTDPQHVASADLNSSSTADGADIQPFVDAMLAS